MAAWVQYCARTTSTAQRIWRRRCTGLSGCITTTCRKRHWGTKPQFKHSKNGRWKHLIYSSRTCAIIRDLTCRNKKPNVVLCSSCIKKGFKMIPNLIYILEAVFLINPLKTRTYKHWRRGWDNVPLYQRCLLKQQLNPVEASIVYRKTTPKTIYKRFWRFLIIWQTTKKSV